MGNAFDFLAATKTVASVKSPINGQITVIRSLGFGTYIQVGGLTQSGGVVYDVWKTTLRKARKNIKSDVSNCLILGLGGGSAAKIVRGFWSNTNIVGVDIDPLIVELGKKYLKFFDDKVKVVLGDAYKLVKNKKSEVGKKKYDLILVDMYVGHTIPENLTTPEFIRLLKALLTKDGVIIFNRLYYGEKRSQAVKFLAKLEKEFKDVSAVYPEANVMYVCKD